MNFDHLRYFVEAARGEHLGRAAKVAGISQSAISHAVRALETELGHKLFLKQGRRARLTEQGRRLAARAERILGEVGALKTDLSSGDVVLTGTLRLAGSHGLASAYVAAAWSRLHRRHPSVSAEISSLRSAEILQRVAGGELDLGLCYSPQAHPAVVARTLRQGNLVFSVRKGHPILKAAAGNRLAKLSDYSMLAPKAFHGIENCEEHPILAAHGIRSPASVLFDSYDVAVEGLRRSDAWALLPEWIVDDMPSLVRVVARGPSAPLAIALVWPKVRPPGRASAFLIQELKALTALR